MSSRQTEMLLCFECLVHTIYTFSIVRYLSWNDANDHVHLCSKRDSNLWLQCLSNLWLLTQDPVVNKIYAGLPQDSVHPTSTSQCPLQLPVEGKLTGHTAVQNTTFFHERTTATQW